MAIEAALQQKGRDVSAVYVEPSSSRDYICSVDWCQRKGTSGGFCNAHYLRHKRGADMDAPIRAKKHDDLCLKCSKPAGKKGGWGLCSAHYKRARFAVIKDACIKALGGSCSDCGGRFPRAAFDFHHLHSKLDAPSALIGNSSPKRISKELANCILLCANCHRIEHAEADFVDAES